MPSFDEDADLERPPTGPKRGGGGRNPRGKDRSRGASKGTGKGGSSRPSEQNDRLISKKLSWLLRHGAEKEGFKLDEGGFLNCAELLSWRTLRSMQATWPEIQRVVSENDKKRYEIKPIHEAQSTTAYSVPSLTEPEPNISTLSITDTANDGVNSADAFSDPDDPSQWLIRAVQGHSLEIASEHLLEPLAPSTADCPRVVVHGTTPAAWQLIQKTGGLSKMTRGHVHFASGTGNADLDREARELVETTTAGDNANPDSDTKTNSSKAKDASEEASTADLSTVPSQGNASTDTILTNTSADTPSARSSRDTPHSPSERPPPPPRSTTSTAVISGLRASATVLIWVDVWRAASQANIKWWRSGNGVILSEGDSNGFVPLEFVALVQRRSGRGEDERRVRIWPDVGAR